MHADSDVPAFVVIHRSLYTLHSLSSVLRQKEVRPIGLNEMNRKTTEDQPFGTYTRTKVNWSPRIF